MNNYEVMGAIGQGQYGTAYKARHKIEDKLYCLKRITMTAKDDRREALREAQLLSSLNHPNIISYKESFLDQTDALCIVTSFCDEGDLFNKIRKRAVTKQYFIENDIMDMFIQTASALMYIHSRKILHRDLKTQNIFLARGNIVQLGDFGISKVLEKTDSFATTVTGTPYYMAPEICTNQPYTFKSDIWSLGCVLYELCTLKHAFAADSLLSLVYQIVRGDFPPIPTDVFSKGLSDLVNSLLVRDQNTRPSLHQIFQMPYVQMHLQRYHREERRRVLKTTSKKKEQPVPVPRNGALPQFNDADDGALTPREKLARKKEQERQKREFELQVASINNQKDKAIAQQRKQQNLYESNVNIGSSQSKYSGSGTGSRPTSGNKPRDTSPLNLTAIEQSLGTLVEPEVTRPPVRQNPWDLGTTQRSPIAAPRQSQSAKPARPAENMGYGTGLDDSLVIMGTMTSGMASLAPPQARPTSARTGVGALPMPAFGTRPASQPQAPSGGYDLDDDVLMGSVMQTNPAWAKKQPLPAINTQPGGGGAAGTYKFGVAPAAGPNRAALNAPPAGYGRGQDRSSDPRNRARASPGGDDDYDDDFEDYEDDDFEEYDPSEDKDGVVLQQRRQILSNVVELEKSMSMSDDLAEQMIAGVQERVAPVTKSGKTQQLKKQCESGLGSSFPQIYAYLKKVRTAPTPTDEKEVQKRLLDMVGGNRERLQGCFMVDQLVFQEMMYT